MAVEAARNGDYELASELLEYGDTETLRFLVTQALETPTEKSVKFVKKLRERGRPVSNIISNVFKKYLRDGDRLMLEYYVTTGIVGSQYVWDLLSLLTSYRGNKKKDDDAISTLHSLMLLYS